MRRWALLLVCAGCTRGDAQSGHAMDRARLTRPAELVRLWAAPGDERDRRLGARHIAARSSLKIEPAGRPVEQLDEAYQLDADGRGALHLVHDNQRGYGFEAVVTGGQLYVRPRYGKFVARRPEGDEVERLRRVVEGAAGDYVDLLGRWLTVREDGPTEVAGRAALRLKIVATSSPSKAEPHAAAGQRWRDTVEVRYADGELTVDAQSGQLLAARLDAAYTFARPDLGGPVAVSLSFAQSIAAAAPIVAPADAVESPARPRPLLDRQALLDGLGR